MQNEIQDITLNIPEKKITVTIAGKNYQINTLFSLNDYETSFLIEDGNEPEHILGEIIQNHILTDVAERPSVDEIIQSDILPVYMEKVLESSPKIKARYEAHTEIENLTLRFLTAVNEYSKEQISGLGDALKNVKFPKIEIPKQLYVAIPQIDFSNTIPDYTEILLGTKAMAEIFAQVTAQMRFPELTKNVSKILSQFAIVSQESMRSVFDRIAESIIKIGLPFLSKERIEEIREAQRLWGDYGWTMPDHSRLKDFFNAPPDKKTADKIGMSYCKAEQMEKIFEKTLVLKGVKKADYQEAIDNFHDRRYKSCALVLFSLIDAMFIRMMKKEDRDNRQRRPVGVGAAKKAMNRIKDEQIGEEWCFALFRHENLFSCLCKVFENGNDFKKQPDVINRNFLDHGMSTRNVRKRDCIQLFLLYYNILDFMGIFE